MLRVTSIGIVLLAAGGATFAVAVDETAAPAASAPSVTWHGRIAAIARERCERCHHVGGPAPFELASADDFAGAAKMVRETVNAGLMPPWVATPESGPFANDMSLRPDEKRDLLAWLDAGTPLGEPPATPPPPFVAPHGWRIGEPDLIVESPQSIAIPADGVVDYLTLDTPSGLDRNVWVDAVQILCENPTICHHIGVRAVYDTMPRQEFIAFYLPGSGGTELAPGFAMELRAGATIRFDFHYTPDGTPHQERTRIGFRFAKSKPTHRVTGRIVSRSDPISIPAGDPNHVVTYEHEILADMQIRRLIPHMHLRGKSVAVDLIAPDGTITRPLELKRWDPDWQYCYEFAAPLQVAAGSRLRCTHVFDNSAANPLNPDPKVRVRAGPQIWDEMACIYVETDTPADESVPRQLLRPAGRSRGGDRSEGKRRFGGAPRSTDEADGGP